MKIKAVLLASVMLFALAHSATAETVTVQGTGDIDKMVVKNNQSAVVTKVWGLGPKCGGAQYLFVYIMWADSKAAYQVDGSCIEAGWHKGLFYMADRTHPENSKQVDCDGLKMNFSADTKAYTVTVPRSCIPKADNRIKVKARGHNYGSMVEGKAGPTRLLRRG
jgi:hypothetical protein